MRAKMKKIEYYVWQDVCRTGIQSIDEDHERFFAIYNVFVRLFADDPAGVETHHLYRAVVSYVQLHFHAEEVLMDQYCYPEREAHCKEHHRFSQTWEKYEALVVQGTIEVYELMGVLRDWLKHHIPEHDLRFGHYVLLENDKAKKRGE
ncbi:putative Hemerythrin domain-containing protein [Azospirillaceae bacterium]